MCGLIYFFHAHFLRFRTVGTEGQGGRSPPPKKKTSADQQSLFQPRGGNKLFSPHYYLPPRIFIRSYCPVVHLVLWCQHATIIRALPVFHWIRKWVLRTATGEKKINYHGRFLLAWLRQYTSAKLWTYAQSNFFQSGSPQLEFSLVFICKSQYVPIYILKSILSFKYRLKLNTIFCNKYLTYRKLRIWIYNNFSEQVLYS